MADKHNREIPLDDARVFAMVQEKGVLVDEGREMAREVEELGKKYQAAITKLEMHGGKVNKLKLKIIKAFERSIRPQLGEFDIPVTTEIKDGKLVVIVTDALAEFKETFSNFDPFTQAVPRKK